MIVEIKKASPDYQTTELCTLFKLALSTHYYQINNQMSDEKQEAIEQIKLIAIETQHTYGKRRTQVELANRGIEIGIYKTASLMKKANVIAIKPKSGIAIQREKSIRKRIIYLNDNLIQVLFIRIG